MLDKKKMDGGTSFCTRLLQVLLVQSTAQVCSCLMSIWGGRAVVFD